MNEKEKAKELVERFYNTIDEKTRYFKFKTSTEQAKQCALICVDELLEQSYQNFHRGITSHPKVVLSISDWYKTEQLKYWLKVKEEIKQL